MGRMVYVGDDYDVGDQYEINGDVVGEITRGGRRGPDQVGAAAGLDEIIGALLNPGTVQNNPTLRNALVNQIARSKPVLKRVAPTAWRKWQTGIGPVYIAAGGTGTVTISPQCLFRVEKLYLTDVNGAGVGAGYASFVTGITVGQQNQMPNNTSIPVWAFGPGLLGNGVEWDTCQGAYTMTITFNATYACTVSGALFGQAVKSS